MGDDRLRHSDHGGAGRGDCDAVRLERVDRVLGKIVPQQAWLTEHGGDLLFALVGSVYFGARLIHLPASVDWAVQGVASAFAFAGVVWTYWRRRDPALSFAFFATAIFLFTPYILNYDMVILGFVVASLRGRDDNTMADHWLLIAVWTLPITMMIGAVVRDSAGADRADPVCVPAALAIAARRTRRCVVA